MKFGDLVGVDENGNKYYQNKMYFMGNNCHQFRLGRLNRQALASSPGRMGYMTSQNVE